MKGIRFFAALPEERGSKSASKQYPMQPWTVKTLRGIADAGKYADCVAVYTDRSQWCMHGGSVQCEAVAGVYSHENSACTTTSVGLEWLRKRCVRVPEDLARKLHPALFNYLD